MVGAEAHAYQMRRDQTNPADDAAHGDAGGGNQPDGDEGEGARETYLDAESARVFFAQRERQQLKAQTVEDEQAAADAGQRQQQAIAVGGGEAAHQPEDDGGQLVLRIGNEFDQRHASRENATDDNTGEHQQHGTAAPTGSFAARQPEHGGERRHAEDERADDEGLTVAHQQHGEHAAEGCAGRNAEQLRFCQRIPEQTLQGGARRRQPRADEGGEQHARQTYGFNHPRRHCGFRVGAVEVAGEQNCQHLRGRNQVASQR